MSNAIAALNYATLDDAVATLGSTATTLTISTALSVAMNTTVPSTLTLEFTGSGSLVIPNGVTLTINGSIKAPLTTIFTIPGTGVLRLGPRCSAKLYPQWWGAKADGIADDQGAIQAALDIAANGHTNGASSIVFLPAGNYVISSRLKVPPGVSLIGQGLEGSVIIPTSCDAITMWGSDWAGGFALRNIIRGIQVDMVNASSNVAVNINTGYMIKIEDCMFWNCGAGGIVMASTATNCTIWHTTVTGLDAATGTGISISGSSSVNFFDVDVEAFQDGIHCTGGFTYGFFGLYMERNSSRGLVLDACQGCTIQGAVLNTPNGTSPNAIALINGTVKTVILGGTYSTQASPAPTIAIFDSGGSATNYVLKAFVNGGISAGVTVI
ncbi:MAG: glycosyl hydrolase family 28-related protein [Nitrospira sp.]|nr:glycosyl hydrolase family 28-related protein [Nitrospira sp.]